MANIFEPVQLGSLVLTNRVFMAPLTRTRADADGVPSKLAATYYAQRASAGLIVTEATQISPMGKGYANTPGIHSPAYIITEWNQERILLQKKYTGLDGVGRPGNLFSHVVGDLPPRRSRNYPEYASEFLAQDAIELWRSPFWKNSEDHLEPPNRLDLPEVLDTDLRPGVLNERDMVKVQDFLPFVTQAFMMLKGNQQLYIAAEPDTVAALIWGLTHMLPRTLRVMHSLTFSTFEREIEKTSATIAGTCWSAVPAPGDAASSRYDLPPGCYQGNGLAINCYLHARQLPSRGRSTLPTGTDEAEFALFATQCLVQQQTWKLKQLLTRAEKANVTQIGEFFKILQNPAENPFEGNDHRNSSFALGESQEVPQLGSSADAW